MSTSAGADAVGASLKWAMAWRSEKKLEDVAPEIGAPASTPLVVADAR